MAYKDYLKSEQWQKKREHMLRCYGGKCMFCDSRSLVDIHHLYYRWAGESILGKEEDHQLMVLCRECHFTWHKLFRYKIVGKKAHRRIRQNFKDGMERSEAVRLGGRRKHPKNPDIYAQAKKVSLRKLKVNPYRSKKPSFFEKQRTKKVYNEFLGTWKKGT